MPDVVVEESEDVELVDVAGVVELDETAVVDGDSTGGDGVVQADVMVASPNTTAMPSRLNDRPTVYLPRIRDHSGPKRRQYAPGGRPEGLAIHSHPDRGSLPTTPAWSDLRESRAGRTAHPAKPTAPHDTPMPLDSRKRRAYH
jgi:hypothetical protein